MDGIPADRRRNKSPHQDPLSPGQPRRPAGRGFRRCGTLHETPRNRPLLCACERDPTDRNQLGLPERRNPGPLERRESVPVAGPFAQKEKAQPDISCLRTPPVLSPANRRTGRLFDHFAGKTPEIFRTVPGNRCANRLYGTFARQRGDIVRQHRNDNHECRGPTVGRRSFGSADYCHQGSNDHPPVLSAR